MKLLLVDAMHIIGNVLAMDNHDQLTKSFCSEIDRIKRTIDPSHMLICFDDLSRSWRRDMAFEYKQSCNGMSMATRIEAGLLATALKAKGYKTSCHSTMEARDIIGSVVKRIEANEGMAEAEIVIAAGGKRYLPMVSNMTYLFSPYNTGKQPKKKTLDVVKAEYNMSGKSLLEYFSLIGDTTIAVSGVKGIGPANAKKLLGEYGTLRELHANKSMIQGVLGENLRAGLAQDGDCLKSYHILNFKKSVSIGMNLSELFVGEAQQAA
ncbi:5'-3' exonuclease H3TH domain-containing protein [Vibrio owensii]|uniref:5'-3' exonuclease H3TH domain-containing protein n=1 Tax=Vibrio harveyi group TaxID=717610 RepID=UPI003CC56F14